MGQTPDGGSSSASGATPGGFGGPQQYSGAYNPSMSAYNSSLDWGTYAPGVAASQQSNSALNSTLSGLSSAFNSFASRPMDNITYNTTNSYSNPITSTATYSNPVTVNSTAPAQSYSAPAQQAPLNPTGGSVKPTIPVDTGLKPTTPTMSAPTQSPFTNATGGVQQAFKPGVTGGAGGSFVPTNGVSGAINNYNQNSLSNFMGTYG